MTTKKTDSNVDEVSLTKEIEALEAEVEQSETTKEIIAILDKMSENVAKSSKRSKAKKSKEYDFSEEKVGFSQAKDSVDFDGDKPFEKRLVKVTSRFLRDNVIAHPAFQRELKKDHVTMLEKASGHECSPANYMVSPIELAFTGDPKNLYVIDGNHRLHLSLRTGYPFWVTITDYRYKFTGPKSFEIQSAKDMVESMVKSFLSCNNVKNVTTADFMKKCKMISDPVKTYFEMLDTLIPNRQNTCLVNENSWAYLLVSVTGDRHKKSKNDIFPIFDSYDSEKSRDYIKVIINEMKRVFPNDGSAGDSKKKYNKNSRKNGLIQPWNFQEMLLGLSFIYSQAHKRFGFSSKITNMISEFVNDRDRMVRVQDEVAFIASSPSRYLYAAAYIISEWNENHHADPDQQIPLPDLSAKDIEKYHLYPSGDNHLPYVENKIPKT